MYIYTYIWEVHPLHTMFFRGTRQKSSVITDPSVELSFFVVSFGGAVGSCLEYNFEHGMKEGKSLKHWKTQGERKKTGGKTEKKDRFGKGNWKRRKWGKALGNQATYFLAMLVLKKLESVCGLKYPCTIWSSYPLKTQTGTCLARNPLQSTITRLQSSFGKELGPSFNWRPMTYW